MVVIKFKEVADRNTSETLRGKNLFVERDQYKLDEDSYFLEDLLESSVFSDTSIYLGQLIDVIQNTYQDIYVIKKEDGKSFLVPAVKEFIKSVDTEEKKVFIHLIDGMI